MRTGWQGLVSNRTWSSPGVHPHKTGCSGISAGVTCMLRLEKPFLVATLVGKNLFIKSNLCDYCVSVCGRDAVVDLILLEMSDFDMILGMDWLALFHATMDCHQMAVKFSMPGERAFIVQGDRSEVPNNLISMLRAH